MGVPIATDLGGAAGRLLSEVQRKCSIVAPRAALDPEETFGRVTRCKRRGHNRFVLAVYPITSSAAIKTAGGISRPIAVAALRFGTVS